VLSVRSHGAPEDPSFSVSDGRRSALSILPAVVVDFGIHRIQLGLPDCGGGIDAVDHVVLPLFPWRRCAHVHDRRRTGWRLPFSLHHVTAAGLRVAYGRDRALCCAGDRHVRDPQSGLVRTRRRLGVDPAKIDSADVVLYPANCVMAEFTVNPKRFDPYKNFKFRVKWDGRYVAGVSKRSGLRRTTEVIHHREGGDPSTTRKSPGLIEFAPITLERGVTHDAEFENWANKVWSLGAGLGAEVSLKDFR